jgi:hypothetical protein
MVSAGCIETNALNRNFVTETILLTGGFDTGFTLLNHQILSLDKNKYTLYIYTV